MNFKDYKNNIKLKAVITVPTYDPEKPEPGVRDKRADEEIYVRSTDRFALVALVIGGREVLVDSYELIKAVEIATS